MFKWFWNILHPKSKLEVRNIMLLSQKDYGKKTWSICSSSRLFISESGRLRCSPFFSSQGPAKFCTRPNFIMIKRYQYDNGANGIAPTQMVYCWQPQFQVVLIFFWIPISLDAMIVFLVCCQVSDIKSNLKYSGHQDIIYVLDYVTGVECLQPSLFLGFKLS